MSCETRWDKQLMVFFSCEIVPFLCSYIGEQESVPVFDNQFRLLGNA